jgi:uncharacterized protein YciU (UPF0263 family)
MQRAETVHKDTLDILIGKETRLISKTALLQSIDVQLGITQSQLDEANLIVLQVMFYLRDGADKSELVTDYLPKHILGDEVVEAWQEKQPEITEKALIEYDAYIKVLPPSYALVSLDSSIELFQLTQDALEGNEASREGLIQYFENLGRLDAANYWADQRITRSVVDLPRDYKSEEKQLNEQGAGNEIVTEDTVHVPSDLIEIRRQEIENDEEARLKEIEIPTIDVPTISLRTKVQAVHRETLEIINRKLVKLISKSALLQSIDVQLGITQSQLDEANLIVLQVMFYLRDGADKSELVTDYLPKHILGDEVVEAWQEKQPEITEKALIEYDAYIKVLPPSYALVSLDSSIELFQLTQDALEGIDAAREKLITYFDKKDNQKAVIYWRQSHTFSELESQTEITRNTMESSQAQTTETNVHQGVKLPDELMDSNRKEAENEAEARLKQEELQTSSVAEQEPANVPQVIRLPSVVIEANKKQAEMEEEQQQMTVASLSNEATEAVGIVRLPSVVIEANKKQAEELESKQIEEAHASTEVRAEPEVVRIPSVVLEANRIKSEEEELQKGSSEINANAEEVRDADIPKAAPEPTLTENIELEQLRDAEKVQDTIEEPQSGPEAQPTDPVTAQAEEKQTVVQTTIPESVHADAPELKPELKKEEPQTVPAVDNGSNKVEKVVEESKAIPKEPQVVEEEEPPKQEQPKPVDPMNTQPKPQEQKPKAEPEKTSTCCGCF